ncbi:MAG: hypothetical protein RL497_2115 [Pseudomonadota bacterium]
MFYQLRCFFRRCLFIFMVMLPGIVWANCDINSLIPGSMANVQITHQVQSHSAEQTLISHFGDKQLNLDLGFEGCVDCLMAGGSYIDIRKNRRQLKILTLLDPNMGDIGLAQVEDTYHFTSRVGGSWVRVWQWGKQKGRMKGSFKLVENTLYTGFAPSSVENLNAQLTFLSIESQLPPEQTPNFTQATHQYITSTSFSVDLGDPNFSPVGLYEYAKTSNNQGLDSGFNETFQAPYAIEYTFTSPRAGTFKEVFAGGLFVWTGEFRLSH